MKNKTILFFIFLIISAFFSNNNFAQTIRTVGGGGDYSSISAAFTAINNGNITGSIELRIISSHTTAAATLNASGSGSANYSSVLIYPTGSGYSISGNLNDNLINFNGAKNVTIDGRVNQSGSANLTITNTNTGTASSTIRFINSAETNTVKYCNILGSSLNTSGGVINFSTSTTGNGNDGNIVEYNLISNSANANRPVNVIYSLGTAIRENSSNIIRHNSIYNFFRPSSTSFGINISSNSTQWTIEGNSFYETTAFAPSANNAIYNVINIDNTSGNTFNITGNFIGGSAVNAGGAAWDFGTSANLRTIIFTGIYINAATTLASSVQNNTIRNITYVSSSSTPWYGININAGDVNIGSITGNVIGASTGNASISITNGNSNGTVYGIFHNSMGNVSISNNSIGSITLAGSLPRAFNVAAIHITTNVSGNTIINNNLIGSTSTSQSIYASTANTTGNTGQTAYGIYNGGPGNAIISGNTIANLFNAYNGNNSLGRTSGIYNDATAGSTVIDNNTISDIYTEATHSGSREAASVTGITQASAVTGTSHQVTRNKISDINNNHTSQTNVYGIYFTSSSASGNAVSRNMVRNVNSSSSSSSSIISSIYVYNSTAVIDNNIIVAGQNIANGATIYGIWDEGLSTGLYHNTVYIESSGTSTTYALFSNTSNTRNYRNNILFNARSGGTNYAAGITSVTNLVINYNDYFVSGTGGILARISGVDRTNLAGIQTATSQDLNSINLNPQFDNAGGTMYSDYYTDVFLALFGVSGTGISIDYTGAARNTVPRLGALERNDFVWQGGTSTDFGTASNWLNNSVPSPGANIIFAVNPDRNCLLDANRIVGNITNAQSTDIMYANGHKLTILGNLVFTNGARIDAQTASSTIEIAGIEAQNIPAGSFVNNYANAFILNTTYGFTLQENFTVQNGFTLTNGNFSIGANTLTLNGDISVTSGTLSGGNTSILVIGGSGSSSILPGITLQSLTLNRANGISLGGNLVIQDELILTDGTLTTSANTITMNGSDISATTGSIDASNSAAYLIFNNTSVINLPAGVFSAAVNNLIINGAGLTAGSDFSVNGQLALNASNQSATGGLLDMGANHTLTMGSSSTTTGQGDVSGRIYRNSITPLTVYTFGSAYSTISFNSSGTAPDDILFIIKIGQAHPVKASSVARSYEIVQSGGISPNRFSLKLRYLDSELNGNEETKLVYWDHHIPYAGTSPHEHGKTIQNTTENWIMLSEHGIRYLATEEYAGEVAYIDDILTPQNKSKIWMFSEKETIADYVWTGADDTDWNNVANWSGGAVPVSTSTVYIPDAADTPNDPILPAVTEIQRMVIEQGGILYGGTTTSLTVNGRLDDDQGIVSWSNSGTFFPGTSTVSFTNGKSAIAGITDFYNVNIPAGDSLRIISGGIMRIAGELDATGILHTVLDAPTTVEYNGDNQDVIVPNNTTDRYFNLILSGSGIKTLPSQPIEILGDFAMDGTASATAAGEITFKGNFSIGESASIATGNYDHELLGNFENNGSFSAASGFSFLMNGTITQTISGTSATGFDNLEINNPAGVEMYADVNINNELSLNTGNLNVGAFTLGINGTIDKTSNIVVSSQSSLSFGGSDPINITDDLFTTEPSINNLTIARSGGVVVGNQEFTVNGTLALDEGEFDNSDKTLTIKGDISRITGSLTTNINSNLHFDENLNLLILPDDMFTSAPSINNLRINRSGGIETANQEITVNDLLILTNGILNNNSLIILTAGAGVSTDGYNSVPGSAFSYLQGCLRKIGNTTFTFPVGSEDRFAPIGISESKGGGDNIDDYFTACYYPFDPGLSSYNIANYEAGINHISQKEYWQLDRTGSNQVEVTLNWGSHSGIINVLNDLRVARWNGTQWVSHGNQNYTGNPLSGNIQSDLITSFSPFTLASVSNDNALPIELLEFKGESLKDKILLEWKTASETNNDYFTVEKSFKLEEWSEIGRIKGAGNSTNVLHYNLYDMNPQEGIQYYRLKQTDYDYAFEYSDVIAVEYFVIQDLRISVFPNPASDFVNIYVSGKGFTDYDLRIISNLGNILVEEKNLSTGLSRLDITSLAKGVYVVEIMANGIIKQTRLIKVNR